jgi:hypothetical protein
MKQFNSSLFIFVLIFFSACSGTDTVNKEAILRFELLDSIKIDISHDFGFVSTSSNGDNILAYSYLDESFFLLHLDGTVELNFIARGEGPKEYSDILPFAGIYNEKLFFLDHKNLYYFSLNGEFISSTPYKDPFVSTYGGLPSSELFFLNDSSFIIPNVHIGDLPRRSDHLSILDTIPVWVKYKLSPETNSFERSQIGLYDNRSTFYNELRFNTYKSFFSYINGSMLQIPLLGSDLFKYKLGLDNQIEKFSLNIPDFQVQQGLDVEKMTIDNNKLFNKMGEESSFINFFVSMDSNDFFLIYSIKNQLEHFTDIESKYSDVDTRFYGYYYQLSSKQGVQVELPKNGEDSFWKKSVYLGDNNFLFVSENEVERDYYIGKIYRLVDE